MTAKSLLPLVREQAPFRLHVPLESLMPVEMIGRDVQRRSNMGAKCFGGFQLKTGKLQNVPLRIARRGHERSRRSADVAAYLHGYAARLKCGPSAPWWWSFRSSP